MRGISPAVYGSSPARGTINVPATEKGLGQDTLDFAIWLLRKKGNRESTIKRKIRFLKYLKGTPEEMIEQILRRDRSDETKRVALNTVYQYAEFLGTPIEKVPFRVYHNQETYVPTPEMIRKLVYRIVSLPLRVAVMIAIETGASLSEVGNLKWRDINFSRENYHNNWSERT